ncbi:PREDICTED: ubiquitin-like protein FUBI [Priapulus caudatus]|uniref:Ubiquitin-like protein FUBI n=1 Tax=Priapulus caudatus TaxID=37621 RepID=A0ABM1DPY2_PRICU|nr:PREDICTED: ubiquitin-like protein FUBI [Priapulus caudatus]XP_014662003.1 PREDICTED: ubiquitin-like protein FUBI [Priapulus caudatus]
MQLFIQGQKTHAFEVATSETVQDIKARLALLEGIPADDQVLTLAGQPLDDGFILSACATENCTVSLTARLVGGKVHGSLARAGKVKGQTPKVEAGEKKKKKTGRAKRRLQYNRRFVNVVQTFGKRRGPNSNTPAS